MNTQRITTVLLVAGLAAGVVWWQWPAAKAPKRIPLTHRAAPTAPEEAEVSPVPPPNEPAEPPPTPTVATDEPPPSPSPGFDPQADLSTAVPDFIRLVQSGDFVTLVQTYMPPQQGMTDAERVAMGQAMGQMMQQDPQAQQRMQKMISDMQFIQNSPPIISGNGDRATYTLPAGSEEQNVVFIKVNGRWYRE